MRSFLKNSNKPASVSDYRKPGIGAKAIEDNRKVAQRVTTQRENTGGEVIQRGRMTDRSRGRRGRRGRMIPIRHKVTRFKSPLELNVEFGSLFGKTSNWLDSLTNKLEDQEDFELRDLLRGTLSEYFDEGIAEYNNFKHVEDINSLGGRRENLEEKKSLERFKQIMKKMRTLSERAHREFAEHKGGFSAKGRAHSIWTQTIAPTDPAPPNMTKDGSFYNSFTVDGKVPTKSVAKSGTGKEQTEKAKKAIVMGREATLGMNKRDTLALLESELAAPQNQAVTYRSSSVKKKRGAGQYAAMANTNATGYAFLSNIAGWQGQRWEWLHIRGAALGGATNSTNLVAGTRDANTHMMPFESNIGVLASEAGKNANYDNLEVIWQVGGGLQRHAYSNITITWKLKGKGDTPNHEGSVRFNPLATATSISKSEVELIEIALKEARDNLNRE